MSEALAPGQRVADRYLVEALVGVGGISEVYRVRHVDLGTVHALKLLTWRRKQLAARFEREGRFQARLRHPNVVNVTDFLRFDGQIALVMEYVEGPTLEQHLAEHGPLSTRDALALLVPILAAVSAAHDELVWHRDLKPANVLLGGAQGAWIPKVTDFGIAKFVADEQAAATSSGLLMGTYGYIAPEQVRDAASVDQRADVFALGAIGYEMLTGRKAFADPDGGVSFASTLEREPPPLGVFEVPARVEAALRRAMARDREDRFPDCRAFARALGSDAPPMPVEAGSRPIRTSLGERALHTLLPEDLSTPKEGWARAGSRAQVLAAIAVGALLASGGAVLGLVAVWTAQTGPDPAVPVVTAPVSEMPPVPPPTASPRRTPPVEAPPVEVVPREASPKDLPPPEAPEMPVGPSAGTNTSSSGSFEPPVAQPLPASAPSLDPLPSTLLPAVADRVGPPAIDAPLESSSLVRGTWTGKADTRNFVLKIGGPSDGQIEAEGMFELGRAATRLSLSGRFDPATGELFLRSGRGELTFTGTVTGRSIRGTYQSNGRQAMSWSVSR